MKKFVFRSTAIGDTFVVTAENLKEAKKIAKSFEPYGIRFLKEVQ